MSQRRGRKIIEREIEKEFFDSGFGKDDKAAWKQAEKARKRIRVQVRKDEDVADKEHKDRDAAVEENVKRLLRVSEDKIDSGSEKVKSLKVTMNLQTQSLSIIFSKAIVDDDRRKKRAFKRSGDASTGKKKRKAEDKSGGSVFTDTDFAAVGEFLKTELIKKKT